MVLRKYPLPTGVERHTFNIPEGARLLGIYPHGGVWCLWAIGDPYAPERTRYFRVFMPKEDGASAGPCRQQDYVGSYWLANSTCLVFEEYP